MEGMRTGIVARVDSWGRQMWAWVSDGQGYWGKGARVFGGGEGKVRLYVWDESEIGMSHD